MYLRSRGGFASTGNVMGFGLTVLLFLSSGATPMCSKAKTVHKINSARIDENDTAITVLLFKCSNHYNRALQRHNLKS